MTEVSKDALGRPWFSHDKLLEMRALHWSRQQALDGEKLLSPAKACLRGMKELAAVEHAEVGDAMLWLVLGWKIKLSLDFVKNTRHCILFPRHPISFPCFARAFFHACNYRKFLETLLKLTVLCESLGSSSDGVFNVNLFPSCQKLMTRPHEATRVDLARLFFGNRA